MIQSSPHLYLYPFTYHIRPSLPRRFEYLPVFLYPLTNPASFFRIQNRDSEEIQYPNMYLYRKQVSLKLLLTYLA